MFFYIHLHRYVLYTRALLIQTQYVALPRWLSGKESIFQCRRHGFNPCVQENPLEEKTTTPSNILTWEMPWTEEPGGLQSMGVTKSRTQLSDRAHMHTQCLLEIIKKRETLVISEKGIWRRETEMTGEIFKGTTF